MIALSYSPKCLSFSSDRLLLRPNMKPLLHETHSQAAFGLIFADVSRLQYTLKLPPIASSQSLSPAVGSASSILVLANCCKILTLTRSCLAWLAISLIPKSRYRCLVSSLNQRISTCAISSTSFWLTLLSRICLLHHHRSQSENVQQDRYEGQADHART